MKCGGSHSAQLVKTHQLICILIFFGRRLNLRSATEVKVRPWPFRVKKTCFAASRRAKQDGVRLITISFLVTKSLPKNDMIVSDRWADFRRQQFTQDFKNSCYRLCLVKGSTFLFCKTLSQSGWRMLERLYDERCLGKTFPSSYMFEAEKKSAYGGEQIYQADWHKNNTS